MDAAEINKFLTEIGISGFQVERQLDELSPAEFESLKQLQVEINRAFKRWSLANHPDHCKAEDSDIKFARISGLKDLLIKQIELQEGKRWTQNLVRGKIQQKEQLEANRTQKASLIQRAWRQKKKRDRCRAQKTQVQDLRALTAALIAALEGNDLSFRRALSNLWLRCMAYSDTWRLGSGFSMGSPVMTVLVCGIECTLVRILSSVASARGLAGSTKEAVSPCAGAYAGIWHCLQLYRSFQKETHDLKINLSDKEQELQRIQSRYQSLERDHQIMSGELERERSALKQSSQELSRIRDEFPEECRAGDTDFYTSIRRFMSIFKTSKKDSSTLQAEHRALKSEHSRLKDRIGDLRAEMQKTMESLEAAQREVKENKKQIETAQENLDSVLKAHGSLGCQLESEKAAMAELKQKYAALSVHRTEASDLACSMAAEAAEAKKNLEKLIADLRDSHEIVRLDQEAAQMVHAACNSKMAESDIDPSIHDSTIAENRASMPGLVAQTGLSAGAAGAETEEVAQREVKENKEGVETPQEALDKVLKEQENLKRQLERERAAMAELRQKYAELSIQSDLACSRAAEAADEVAWVAAAATRLDRAGTNGLTATALAKELEGLFAGGVSEQQVSDIYTHLLRSPRLMTHGGGGGGFCGGGRWESF